MGIKAKRESSMDLLAWESHETDCPWSARDAQSWTKSLETLSAGRPVRPKPTASSQPKILCAVAGWKSPATSWAPYPYQQLSSFEKMKIGWNLFLETCNISEPAFFWKYSMENTWTRVLENVLTNVFGKNRKNIQPNPPTLGLFKRTTQGGSGGA